MPQSARPTLVVTDQATRLADPATGTVVGMPGPFGRERVVAALPLGGSFAPVMRPTVLRSERNIGIADGAGFVVGRGDVWVARMLYATRTEATRR